MTAPEEQAAEVLAGHQWHHTRDTHCTCGFRTPLAQLAVEGYLAHVAEALAPLFAEERRKAAEEAVARLDAEVESEVARLGGLGAVHASGLLNNWVGGMRAAANVLRGERVGTYAEGGDRG